MLTDPYEACELAGLAEEADMVACDDCGQYQALDTLWQCWACGSAQCDDCRDAHGPACGHWREDEAL